MTMKRLYSIIFFLFVGIIANAQYTKLLDFTADPNGQFPQGSLISDGTYLYGMTQIGGLDNLGIIFKIKPDGTGFLKLLDFTGSANGSNPRGCLISDGTFLYGMTPTGGTNDAGVIFKIKPDGTGFAKLLDFGGVAYGGNPQGTLYRDGTFLYGMTQKGGSNNLGIIFSIKTDGTGFSKLLDFAGSVNGSNPEGSLISDGTFLYGMTIVGGTSGDGTIFKIMPDGTGYSKLLDFNQSKIGGIPQGSLIYDGTFLYGLTVMGDTNSRGNVFKIKPDGTGYSRLMVFGPENGMFPNGSLYSDGVFLYGLTCLGGAYGNGMLFKLKPDGSGYSKLLDFNGENGSRPYYASVISDGIFLYGMTYYGGLNGGGIIYKIKPDGTGYTDLFDFSLPPIGSVPNGSLYSDGTFLYGMTSEGGSMGRGTIFKMELDGTGFVKLLDFTGISNGSAPKGTLISDGTFLYGITSAGGINGYGVIFKMKPDGTEFTKLHDFSGINGQFPQGSLYSDGSFLYGLTNSGGSDNRGTIFKIAPDGTGFSKLYDFKVNINDGNNPSGSLISDGTFLYGMTRSGGLYTTWPNPYGNGTIFRIKPDGTSYSKILDFAGTNGKYPTGSLVFDGAYLYGMAGNVFKIKTDGTGDSVLTNNGANGSNLFFDGTYLYGMTATNGINGFGTLFEIMPNGSSDSILMNFSGIADGRSPYGALISDGISLYGMTNYGGTNDLGTVFKFHPATMGVTDNKAETIFTIYPNPFSTETTLQSDEFLQNASLTVYNSFGQVVKQVESFTGHKMIFHRDNLPGGLYFIRLTQDGKTFSTEKLVITDN